MALVTRTITNAGAPLHSPEGDLLVGVKIHFQLMDTGGRPSDAWDAVSNERVGGETVVATTDAAGEFTVELWPNTRGNRTTKYKCRVQFEGFREFSGVVEDVPGELQWVDFMLGGSAMEPQDIGAIAAAMTSHINAADPHPQYAKEADLGDAASLDVGTTPGTVAAGDDPRLLAVADKVDKIPGKGLSTEDYSTAEKNKLAGVSAGANNYAHPANHPPSIITQDASNRFVTDAEKAAWNAKEPAIAAGTSAQYRRGDKTWQTLDKAVVGLGSVDNVSAATLRDRSTHTGTQAVSTVAGLQDSLDDADLLIWIGA